MNKKAVSPTMASSQLILFVIFSCVFSSAAMYSDKVVLDGGKYNASWYYDEATDCLNFTVTVEASGWVGFGFSVNMPPNNMTDYDVAVGGVLSDGSGYMTDYKTIGRTAPRMDTQQDFNLTSQEEADGKTTLMFTRKRVTGDTEDDVDIKIDMPMYLIWAYHSSSEGDSSITKHTSRGFMEVTFIQSPPAPPPPPPPMMQYTGNVTLNNGKYNASWLYNDGMDYVYFRVDVMATGWVGFGLANNAPTNMTEYDVAVGGVKNGSGYLKDYFTVGRSAPPEDEQQDWNLTYSREMNGVTTLLFHRKINTNDEDDIVIKQGKIFLIWGYHSMYDVEPMFKKHSERGFLEIEIIPEKHVTFANGTFNAYWSYDSVMDVLKFKVVVNATGWIAFGFAKMAPTNMVNYDVAVGGVIDGQGYLQDYLTRGWGEVPADSQQDFKLMYASEQGGATTLMFYRKRNTWDDEDVVIMGRQKCFIVWAFTKDEDLVAGSPPDFPIHTDWGHSGAAMEIIAQDTVMTFDKHMSFDGGAFKAYWSYDSATDRIRFKLVVRATGWIAFGFAKNAPAQMVDYDVAVGGVFNGQGYIQDYFTRGWGNVPADSQQDFKLVYSSEEGGVTTLMYYRNRDTGDDDEDILIESMDKLFLVWAYTDSNDKKPGDFPTHTKKGQSAQAVEIISQETPTRAPVEMNFEKHMSFDGGAFNAYWMYDEQMDTLKIKLVVQATGWIAFGFAKNAPAQMVGYDVAVGGVRGGQGYIQDYFTRGFGKVPADTQQDITLMSSSEEDGVTTLMFWRKRDTGDEEEDYLIMGKQKWFIVWAYNDDNDMTTGEFPTHTKRGQSAQAVEIISQDTPTRAPTTVQTTTVNNAGGAATQEELEEAKKERDQLKILVAVSLGIVSLTFIIVIFGFAYLARKVRVGPSTDSKL